MAAVTGDSLDLSGRSYFQNPSAPDPVRPYAGDVVAAPRDEFDDSFHVDAQIDDIFRDISNDDINRENNNAGDEGQGLGIDEEVKVRKPRPKQAKLDETRLLSSKGIPELRKITKTKLKLRGKGHEFSDVSRLLNTYQLWLDDLFPKANFLDGLSIIEKVGHSRRMQLMRKEWIDEEKRPVEPTVAETEREKDPGHDTMMSGALHDNGANEVERGSDGPLFVPDDRPDRRPTTNEDDLYASPTPQPQPAAGNNADSDNRRPSETALMPEEDDLDQLLAEEEAVQTSNPQPTLRSSGEDDFADDLDAMAEMDM